MSREKFFQQNNKPEDAEPKANEQTDVPPEKPDWEKELDAIKAQHLKEKENFHKSRDEKHLTGEEKYRKKKYS